MSSSSTLAQDVEVVVPRSRHLQPIPCPVADPSPFDEHSQPQVGACPCVSATGRKRRKHAFEVVTRSGLRCLFCEVIRTWSPLRKD